MEGTDISTRNMLCAEEEKVLGLDTEKVLTTVWYYDDKGRVVQEIRTNIMGGYDKTYTAYTFTGLPSETLQEHTAPDKEPVTERYRFVYDNMQRIKQKYYRLNSDAEILLQECTYDANGRLTSDGNRGITGIEYNVLNLPTQITFTNGSAIRYGYSYSGEKLWTKYSFSSQPLFEPLSSPATGLSATGNESERYYSGNKIYNDGTLEMILIDGGYIRKENTGYAYHHYIKEHLGSNCMVVKVNSGVQQVQHYYPFGLSFAEATNRSYQPYKYNGKELVSDEGLNWYDYLARVYDPALLIFTTMDPMAEKYYSISPYAYCGNNPVKYIDPTGMDIWEIDKERNIRNRIEDKTQDAFFMVTKDSDGNYQRTYTLDADGNKVYNSISFEYGTVEFQRTIDINSTGSYDVYQVRGDENGTQMFEFMSQNTEVEWSQAKTGIAGDKGLNFLTTSHEGKDERGMGNLYKKQLYAKYTIRELIHNHPGNTAQASENDIRSSKIIKTYNKKKGLNIPLFKVYLPNSKSYMNY